MVLPTRNRAELLPRAVATVLAQRYTNWELLIVDDASTDATPEVLAGFDDPRIRTFTGPGRGVCAARNVALEAVAGTFVAYVDDDNRMHPDWLALRGLGLRAAPRDRGPLRRLRHRRPPTGAAPPARATCPASSWPATSGPRSSSTTSPTSAPSPTAAGLPEAHFDEELREMGDWDLFLRLTRDTVPLTLPAVACYYDEPRRPTG